MTDCRDDQVILHPIFVHFQNKSPRSNSIPLSNKKVDSWPLKATFLNFLNICPFCVEKNDGFWKIVYFKWKKNVKTKEKTENSIYTSIHEIFLNAKV